MRHLLRLFFGLLYVQGAGAQVMPAGPPPTRAMCDSLEGALNRTRGGSVQLDLLYRCGPESTSRVAGALRNNAAVSDTVYWGSVRLLLWRIRDERVFVLALDLVQDTSASEPARLIALDHLTASAGPGFLTLTSWTAAPRFNGPWAFDACTSAVLTDGPEADPRLTPPRGDLRARVVQALDAVLDDPSLPAVLRGYTECVITGYQGVPRFARAGVLSVSYECDNTFTLKPRAQPRGYLIEFAVAGDSTRRKIGADSRLSLKLVSSRELVVTSGPRVTIRVPHGAQSCLAQRYRERGLPVPAGVDTLADWARPVRK